jgi:replicative DNA helicase
MDNVSTSREPDFARTPPQDLVAEQSVLGGMMLSKDAIADVVEVLRGNDFYRPSHESIYEAILDLYGRGEPADAVTVADELTKRGEIAKMGGAAYLHQLIQSVPTAANAGFYAEIVAERAVLRRLVTAGTKIVQMGYAQDGEVEDVVNAAQAEIFKVAERRTTEDYVILKDVMESTVDEIEASGHKGEGMTGVPTGFYEFDELTNGLHPGQMIVIAARPAVGKSTFALDWARSAAITHNMATVVFSLEMGRNELAMRLLSAEATINLQDLRKGTVKDDQWSKIATTMGKMNDAPLFIDDSPNMSLMEIRAKCRRLKQQHDLKLVILDYLQLMSSGKRVESRQQEVSEFSRALKLLAKELQVPVVALSQLNRGSEQRTDKKPMVSDLRESGCLTADTRVLRSDTGAETTMGELFASGAKDVPVWSLGDNLRYVERHLTHVFPTGRKPVFKLTLASGRTIRATANHPFFTYEGWRPLGELASGDRLGIPRHVNGPSARTDWDDTQVIQHANILARAEKESSERWPEPLDGHISNGLIFIPEAVFALPKRQIALFLHKLWSGMGEVGAGDAPVIRFATRSTQLAAGLAILLLRFGITTRVCETGGINSVAVEESDDQTRFQKAILPGEGRRWTAGSARGLPAVDSGPKSMAGPWVKVGEILASPTTQALGPVVAVLESAELEVEAVNDLFWDSIVAIDPDGEEEVFDATVIGNHNFIANGIAVHNSIEQDADMVILLHREDIYDKESARAGEADVIVAKHRNGPTKTIVVGFQGHYSRFANMANDGGSGY